MTDGIDCEPSVEEIVETAKDRVEMYAAKAATKDGEEAAFFSGLRAAYAGVVEEHGTQDDFDEALRRGSNARNAALRGDADE